MHLSPLVSVIIPVYNAEKFLETSVRSVMQQSFSTLEIIAVNDCSTDSSLAILHKLQEEDSRILILNNEQNSGISKTLNKGISVAKGEYIARMDADDICFKSRMQDQVDFLEQHTNVAICGGNFLRIDESGTETGRAKYPNEDDILKAELFFYCPFAHPAMMIRKSALVQTGFYDDCAPAEDYELWLRMAEKFSIANLATNLIYYRTHDSNISTIQKTRMFKALNYVLNKHANAYKFPTAYLNYHLKFIEGRWYEKISAEEIRTIKKWKEELIAINRDKIQLNKVCDKYISLAMLSIVKSNQNSIRIKLVAFKKLISINPFITLKHFFK